MATEPIHRRFSVAEYHQMAQIGILTEDDRLELVDGEIVEMSPIGGRHVACVNRLNQLLVRFLDNAAIVSIQSPVRLGDYQEPEPDVAVIRVREYGGDLPGPEDVILLMEVSDSSLAYDRSRKLPIYGRAGIPESWIVDVPGETIERHTNPVDGRYRVTLRVGRGEEIESTVVPGLTVNADDVLGC